MSVVLYTVLRLCGGSITNDVSVLGGSAKKDFTCVGDRSWDHMSSSDVGSCEFKRPPWMQMEGCSAHLARSTSDGSADFANQFVSSVMN